MGQHLNNKFTKNLVISSLLLTSIGCSQFSDSPSTTTYAAATGGVIGAGLGAIVGNQVGNPGAGLAIGMAAGAGTGAAIGQMMEGNEKRIVAAEERINRQDETIRAQKSELASLRGVTADTGIAPTRSVPTQERFTQQNNSNSYQPSQVRFASAEEIAARKALNNKSNFQESTTRAKLDTTSTFSNESNYYSESISSNLAPTHLVSAESKPEVKTDTSAFSQAIDSSLCASDQMNNANSEIQKADRATDSADKLFHIRRALRLCPGNALAHAKLGQTYLAMNRNDDAKLEFQEALKLDPTQAIAQGELEKMQIDSGNSATSPKLPKSNRY